jgi:hypothetical protein
MAVSVNHLETSSDTANATSYTTGTIAPAADRLLCVYVFSPADAASDVGLTGLSLSWTKEATVNHPTETGRRLTLFLADTGASPASGTLTPDFGASTQDRCLWSIYELAGVDLSGGVAAAMVQKDTNTGTNTLTIAASLAAFTAGNATICGCAVDDGFCDTHTGGSPLTKEGDTGIVENNGQLSSYFYESDDTTPGVTFAGCSSGDEALIIAAEVLAASGSIVSRELTIAEGFTENQARDFWGDRQL